MVVIGNVLGSVPEGSTPESATPAAQDNPSTTPQAEGPSVTTSSPSPTPPPVETPPPAPPPITVPATGPGTFVVAPGTGTPVGAGRMTRYTVEIETGLPFDSVEVAAFVEATLADPQGWTAAGSYAFQRVDANPDVHVRISTPGTTDALCAPLQTNGEVSCRNNANVVLNAKRWAFGIEAYADDLTSYRHYLVNHEMGHFIGHGHRGCPGAGQPAPVMLQQTFGLNGCVRNAWPAVSP